jgi:CubicO group peptidase (beta-lactamase class C family)
MRNTYVGSDRLTPLEIHGHDCYGFRVPKWTGVTGAGGIRSSVEDISTFLQAHLSPESSELSEAILLVSSIRTIDSRPAALGWMVASSPEGQVYWHNGGTAGFGSFVGFCPSAQRAAAVLVDARHTRVIDEAGMALFGYERRR